MSFSPHARTVVVLVVSVGLVLLAGCTSPSVSDGTSSSGAEAATTKTLCTDAQRQTHPPDAHGVCRPITQAKRVDFSGNLGTQTTVCAYPPSQPEQCQKQAVVAPNRNLFVEMPGWNVTGLDLNITWSSTTPVTDKLAALSMVMPTCDACAWFTLFPVVEGPSPLRIQVHGVNLALNATTIVHIHVYNPQGVGPSPSGLVYSETQTDLPFAITGTIFLEQATHRSTQPTR